jgi:putative transposase
MYDKIIAGSYYHIFNKGNNGENIFIEEKNYNYFMNLYTKYIFPIADTFAYCLLKNHFHILIKIKENHIDKDENYFSKQFSNFFNSYSKSINKAYGRTGTLFERPFKRKIVDNNKYFNALVFYIHNNPVKHCFSKNILDYPYSSYETILSDKKTNLRRDVILDWFSGVENFKEFHLINSEENIIEKFVIE